MESKELDKRYSKVLWKDDFDLVNTIDLNNTKTNGYNWYRDGSPFGGVTAVEAIDVKDSILKLGDGVNTGSAALWSAVRTQTGQPYNGNSFGGQPLLYEAKIRFDPIVGITSTSSHLAFCAFSAERLSGDAAVQWPGQAPNYTNWIEVDFWEIFKSELPANNIYARTIINWYGLFSGGWQGRVDNYYSRATPMHVGDIDWQDWHTYGWEYVPATASKPGFGTWYFDGIPLNSIYWKGPPTVPPLPLTHGTGLQGTNDSHSHLLANQTFSVIDQQKLVICLLGRNDWPLEVDWVQVKGK